ncbi:unnamed protein product [Rhizophagus irregularis]|nr:unnamed protein product [Rhizophagus irregularis]
MEGPKWVWSYVAQEWTRAGPTKVALKRLNKSQNILSSYIDQIKAYHKCLQSGLLTYTFGITKDQTSNYMIIMNYYENGNLYQYLDRSNGILSWINIIDTLLGIARGLKKIHVEGKVHRNLHGGNLLVHENFLIGEWIALICNNQNPSEIFDEYSIAENRRQIIISQLSDKNTHPKIHPEAYYTSRPLCFLDP